MKKLGVVFLATLMILGLAGCGSSSKGGDVEPYVVDLSKLTVVSVGPQNAIGEPTGGTVRNSTPFSKNYDDLMILLPEFPADLDWTSFSRVTIIANLYNANNELIAPGNGNAMVTLIYDPAGDIRGPGSEGPSRNIPMKTFNMGGPSSSISRDRGYPVRFTEAPRAMLIQNSNINVKYAEVTDIIFHTGSAKPPVETFTDSDLAPVSIVLQDNFEYGNSWLAQFRPAGLMGGYAVKPGEEYELTVTYKASRDLTEPVLFAFINIGTSWTTISTQPETPASKAGEEVSATLSFKIARAGGNDAEGNTLVIQSLGTPDQGVVTLNFTAFSLKKIDNN